MSELKSYKEIPIGSKNVEAGSSVRNETGSWRDFKPVVDMDKCIKCLMCFISCPDATINPTTFGVNYAHCKGCGICAQVCPVGAVTMVEEVV